MAKFAFAARSTDNAVVAAVRGIAGRPIAEIKKRLADGTPFWESDGYFDDPEGVKRRARALVQQLQKLGVEPIIYELDDGDDLESLDALPSPITPEYMEGLFESYQDITNTRKRIDAERNKS